MKKTAAVGTRRGVSIRHNKLRPDFATGKNPDRLPGRLRLEDSDDLMRTRVNDEDFIAVAWL
jgi:hypothetical protein